MAVNRKFQKEFEDLVDKYELKLSDVLPNINFLFNKTSKPKKKKVEKEVCHIDDREACET